MRYRQQLDAVEELVRSATTEEDAQSRVVLYLHDNFDHYDWVGVYLVDPDTGDTLVLGPWKGKRPTEHVRIPFGRGICGSCAVTCRTEASRRPSTGESMSSRSPEPIHVPAKPPGLSSSIPRERRICSVVMGPWGPGGGRAGACLPARVCVVEDR